MATLTARPMRLLFVEFNELFARHLCRHSQLGINVAHLIALFVTWYALYGLLHWMIDVEWVLAVPAGAYLLVVAVNVPLRVLAATTMFLALIVAAVVYLPAPWWAYVIMIPVAYEVQSWSHKIYTVETDMADFNRKYTKGSVLFVVLLIYEVPIVLNFLLFAPSAQSATSELAPTDQDTAAAKAS